MTVTDREIERRPDGTYAPGVSGNARHYGESAIRRIRNGEPFDGLALQALEGVVGELGIDLSKLTGIDAVLLQRAARLEAAARLFDGAAMAAAAAGDLDAWERYQQRMGWIGGKSAAQLEKLRDLAEPSSGILEAALRDAREIGDGDDS